MKFKKLLILLLGVAPLLPYSASALVMRENGPEPIIVQIKESFRFSAELDNRLNELESTRSQNGLHVQKWWAGRKLLVMFSFPSNFTERQALTVIGRLQQLSVVEKVVAVSAFNLEFTPAELAREYAPNQTIPEAARRGLDRDELSRPAIAQINIDEAVRQPHVPNQIIVRWKDRYVWNGVQTGFFQGVAEFNSEAGCNVTREFRSAPNRLIQVLEFDPEGVRESVAETLSRYAANEWVDYVQPNYIYSQLAPAVDDPYFIDPGQPNLLKIKAPEAWNITTGDHAVVVAVADTGANIFHPDFENRLSPGWRNFVTNPPSNDVTDDDYTKFHGSRIGSIIGAEGNNEQFMTGVAQDVSLLILKIQSTFSFATTERIVAAMDYAGQADGHDNASAFNISYGTAPSSTVDPAMADAVEVARSKNMVVVAAAGNGSLNSDEPDKLISPASIPKDNVIAVGATRVRPDFPSLDDTKPTFSNFGKYRVELGAPGGEDPPDDETFGILGLTPFVSDPTYPPYNMHSGTSYAAPHVVGALALVKSKYPWENYAGIRDRVIMGTDDVVALDGVFRTGGRLNLSKALQKRTLIRNLSTRAKVESGDRIIAGGFTIAGGFLTCGQGSPPCLKVAIRGLGPSLPPLSVPRLSNPKLHLYNSAGQLIFQNGDWGSLPQDQQTDLANAGLTPGYAVEAAMVQTLPPGSYTVLLQTQALQQGVALLEIWELSGNTNEQVRLTNISTRCPVGVGDEVPIAGTILGDPNGSSNVPKRRLLMLGRGPSLEKLGVPGVLADPQIELHGSTGALIESNDQWQDVDGPSTSTGLEDKLNDSGFAPTDENESVLWPTLVRGAYTTILQGVNDGTGIGLIEFYEY